MKNTKRKKQSNNTASFHFVLYKESISIDNALSTMLYNTELIMMNECFSVAEFIYINEPFDR